MAAWRQNGFRPVSHLTWVKSHCSRAGFTAAHHEVGFLLAKGRPPKPVQPTNDVLPWQYTGNPFHPNQKPVCAIRPLIEAFSQAGEIVLDPFAGSGTTGAAARQCGRRYIMVEKEERYWQAAKQRIGSGMGLEA
jgi:site-specific DNA-methyltransferase (adenine-specific)